MTKGPYGIRTTIAKGRVVLRWRDPISGFEKQETIGLNLSQKEKDDAIDRKQRELDAGFVVSPDRLKWSAFREEVERIYFAHLQPSSQARVLGTFNVLAEHVKLTLVVDLTSRRIGYFADKLREEGLATATIRLHLRNLKAVLNWGKQRSLIESVPAIVMPRLRRGETAAKGRPLTDDEFASMLAAIPAAIRSEERRPLWEFLLRGLWLSGLRIGEAIATTWDDPAAIRVDLSSDYPFLHFPAGSHKSGEECSVPLTPDFAKLLETVPVDQRTGRVFKLAGIEHLKWPVVRASDLISQMGEVAGIVVKRCPDGTPEGFASAHDLRRSFGDRWARVVMPAVLQRMMRHKSIVTTMTYYATGDVHALAKSIREAEKKAG